MPSVEEKMQKKISLPLSGSVGLAKMAEEQETKNLSLGSADEFSSTTMKSRPSSSDIQRRSRTRPRRRRHRRTPRNDDIPEAPTETHGGRGQISDSSHYLGDSSAVMATYARSNGGSYIADGSPAPPSSLYTRPRGARGQTTDLPRSTDGPAMTATQAKNSAGTALTDESPTQCAGTEVPGTGASDIRTGTLNGRRLQTSDLSRPAEGSAVAATNAQSEGDSVAPGTSAKRSDVETLGNSTSGTRTRTRGSRRRTSDLHRRPKVSAGTTTRAGSDGSSISPDTPPKPLPDEEAQGAGTLGTRAGTQAGITEPPVSRRPAEDTIVANAKSKAGPAPSLTSPTARPDVAVPDEGGSDSKKTPSTSNDLPNKDKNQPPGPGQEQAPVVPSPPAVVTPSPDYVRLSPGAVRDFEGAQHDKFDLKASSMASPMDWNVSPPYGPKTLVRFGTTTLREFIPLTTLTDKVARSPRLYGSLGALVSLASVYLLVMLWTRDSRQRRSACGSDECRSAHAYLDSFLDKDVEPCSDFYRHVCRKWRARNMDGATVADKAARDLVGALHSTLLEKARPHRGTSHAEDRLVRFYAACGNFAASTRVVVGRPFAGIYQRYIDVLRLPDTAASLRRVVHLSLLRGIFTLFGVRIVRHNENAIALYVLPGKTLAEKFADAAPSSTLTAYIREALEQASTTEHSVAKSNIDTTIYELLKFHNEIGPDQGGLLVAEAVNASHFATLIQQADPGLWLEFVNSLLPANSKLSERSPVMCHHMSRIRESVQYLSKKHQIGLLYIFLHILADIGRFYYSSKFASEAEVMCLTATQEVMGPGWFNVFASLTRELISTPSRVGHIFASIRNLSSRHVLDSGLDNAAKWNVRSVLDGVRLLAEYESLRPVLAGNESAAHLYNHTAGFASYYASLKALEAARRLQDPPPLEEVLLGDSLFSADTAYASLLNAVLLPPAARRPPLMYSTRVPLEFDMGTVGVLLSTEVFKAGVPPLPSTDSWYIQNVKKFVDCVQHSTSSLTGSTAVTVSQGLELFALARAVRIAYDVMKETYDATRKQKGFEDVWTSAQQTFFRRFCLMTCSVGNVGLESRLRCLVPVLTTVEFADAFECHTSAVTGLRPCLSLLHYKADNSA